MAKILLVGYGYWGKIWYKTIKKSQHELVAVVDPIFNSNRELVDMKTVSFEKLEDVNKEFTHAIIAVPVEQHFKIYKQLKELYNIPARNILVEKPIGLNINEAEHMKDSCHGLVWLYDKTYKTVKNIIRSGRIGDVKLFQSFRASMGPRIRTDVSIIEDYLFHDIYLYLDLMNNKNRDISNTLSVNYTNLRKSMFTDYDSLIKQDTITVSLDDISSEHSATIELFSSWIYPKKERRTVIVGTEGSLIWENDTIFINTSYYKKLDNSFDKDKNGNIGYELIDGSIIPQEIEPSLRSNLEKLLHDFIGKSLFEGEQEIPTSSFKTKQGNLAVQTHKVINKIKNIGD